MGRTIIPWVKKRQKPKFITLTLKHHNASLSDQIDRLYDCFKTLRRSKLWKSHIKGGIWFFQVKKSDKDSLWHPHIHCLAVGSFLPREELSNKWLSVTGDSSVTDIRAVRDPKKTADYVSRYATAPGDMFSLEDDDAIELFDSLHGRRICGTFGVGKEILLRPKKCEDADEWENIGYYSTVMSMLHKEPAADAIFLAWKTGATTDCSMFYSTKPPPPDYEALKTEPESFKQFVFNWNDIY